MKDLNNVAANQLQEIVVQSRGRTDAPPCYLCGGTGYDDNHYYANGEPWTCYPCDGTGRITPPDSKIITVAEYERIHGPCPE